MIPVSFHLPALGAVFCLALFSPSSPVQAQQSPNTNAAYRQLRNLLPAGPGIAVTNLVLKRDAATFTFAHGSFTFFGEVNGKFTGAVFGGQGHFHLTPPTPTERHSLQVLTKQPEFDADFTQVVLRFTDETAAELRKAPGAASGSSDASLTQAAQEFHTFQREHLHENIDLRILEDVLSPAPGGFFLAAIHGTSNPHILFEIDSHGATEIAPEEVRLLTYNTWGWTTPAAFHLAPEYQAGAASGRQENYSFKVDDEDLDTSIEKNGFLSGLAAVHLHAAADGVAVIPLALYPTLRVSKVEGEHGEVLDFIQERKEDDPDFGLVLAHPLKKGEAVTIKITYGGKDAVHSVGGDNYDPVAREDWFPNGGVGLGSYSTYKMRFHTPKEIELIATGNKTGDNVDGHIRTTEWTSGVPLPVAGFHLGRFVEKADKTPQGEEIEAFANTDLPDWAQSIQRLASGHTVTAAPISAGGGGDSGMAVGDMSTKSMLPVELSQATAAAQIYESYFGKLPFDHIAISQQPACNYGQSWPMLVYLPICGFWDGTVQHELGLRPSDPYWKSVTAHEVAHQWWGQTVGFASYRDQWMSEGFANASAALFLQATRKNNADFREFWHMLKQQLTERNADGFRPIDVGPVTMGYRLSTNKTGWSVYQNLVYPKGAYILHMIRMLMYSPRTNDDDFRAMMHDFTETYRLKVATTEDFKAIVEKHMTPAMDMEQNHRMDWFFNEYVYGTELPHLHFEGQVKSTADGGNEIHFKLEQSGVSENFKMIVPLYIEFNDGRTLRLGIIPMYGNSTSDKTVPIGKFSVPIKRVLIDALQDVLAVEN